MIIIQLLLGNEKAKFIMSRRYKELSLKAFYQATEKFDGSDFDVCFC